MNGIKIRGTGRCVPEKTVTNDDLAKIVDTNDEWITTRTGIRCRHHCSGENHTQLCVRAARAALERAGAAPEEIGVDKKLVKDTFLYCKEIRARYTILQMLWDLGVLESTADAVIASL